MSLWRVWKRHRVSFIGAFALIALGATLYYGAHWSASLPEEVRVCKKVLAEH